MSSVTAPDGTRVGFLSTGNGPPLVLVHGGGADASRWEPIVHPLRQDFTVHAIDRRGRGESGDGREYSLEREAEDLAAVVDSLDQPAFLLGHSYGAICSLEAALRARRLRALALYEPPISLERVPHYPEGTIDRLERMLRDGDRQGVVTAFLREVARVPDAALAQLRAAPSWPARLAAAHTIPREMRAEEAYVLDAARFAGMTVPTTLLLGGDSPPFLRAATDAVRCAVPNGQVLVLQGQQHTAMNTAPELFVHTLREAFR